jgi:hypothetical protein
MSCEDLTEHGWQCIVLIEMISRVHEKPLRVALQSGETRLLTRCRDCAWIRGIIMTRSENFLTNVAALPTSGHRGEAKALKQKAGFKAWC